MADDKVLKTAICIVRDKVYLATIHTKPRSTKELHFFTVDNVLTYQPFFADFGPLHVGCLYRFCMMMESKMEDPTLSAKKLVFYSSQNQQKRANAAYLIASYCVLYLGMTPEEAERPFVGLYPPLLPFRDASYGASTYHLNLIDCLRAICRARNIGFLDFKTFDVEEYEQYEKVENGDLNWIVPGKFIAFSGPHDASSYDMGYRLLTPDDYIPLFKRFGVGTIIRLNKNCYDRMRFVNAGFTHHDMYYIDGGVPSDAITKRFMAACEEEQSAVAVHCKAGLGRTGSLIGLFMMKHFGFTAAEVIAWIRICRPGSVIGPQQHFLHDMQGKMWAAGEAFRRKHGIASPEEEARLLKAARGASPSPPPAYFPPRPESRSASPPPVQPPVDAAAIGGRATTPARMGMDRTPERDTYMPDTSSPLRPRAGSATASLTSPMRAGPRASRSAAERVMAGSAARSIPTSPFTPSVSSENPGRNASGKIRSPGMLPVDAPSPVREYSTATPSSPLAATGGSRYGNGTSGATSGPYASPARRSAYGSVPSATISAYPTGYSSSRIPPRSSSALGSHSPVGYSGRSSPPAPLMMDSRAGALSGRRSATGLRTSSTQRTPPSPPSSGSGAAVRSALVGSPSPASSRRRPLAGTGGYSSSSPYAQRMSRATYFSR